MTPRRIQYKFSFLIFTSHFSDTLFHVFEVLIRSGENSKELQISEDSFHIALDVHQLNNHGCFCRLT